MVIVGLGELDWCSVVLFEGGQDQIFCGYCYYNCYL